MTSNEIRELFKKNEPNENFTSLYDLFEITRNLKIETKMNDDATGYILEADIIEMTKPELNEDVIYNMVSSGWVLSKDRKKVVKYC